MRSNFEKVDNLEHGYSIQGNRVLTNHGQVWGEFASYEIALASVEAFTAGFKRGFEAGRIDGRTEIQQQLRTLLNVPREFASPLDPPRTEGE